MPAGRDSMLMDSLGRMFFSRRIFPERLRRVRVDWPDDGRLKTEKDCFAGLGKRRRPI